MKPSPLIINMSPAARYVLPKRLWDAGLPLGPLTDKRIALYQSQGRYGKIVPLPPKAAKPPKKRDLLLERLMA